ncbi:MAG TPA: hypothetical protein VFP42_05620 [Acidimicrobiia bacterium]|nr:hypothetical protein [Acidimicrobiia bacterium]
MLKDFVTLTQPLHDERVRRHASHPEPLEQPRHGLRTAIGNTLIHLGERLVKAQPLPVDDAA